VSPLTVKVGKISVSRLFPRPSEGAYLKVSSIREDHHKRDQSNRSDLGCVCAELSPLIVKVEKGSVSRLFLRPVKGAYLNVSATAPAKANPDEFQSIATNEGLVYVQYTASGTANTKFGASMGEHQALLDEARVTRSHICSGFNLLQTFSMSVWHMSACFQNSVGEAMALTVAVLMAPMLFQNAQLPCLSAAVPCAQLRSNAGDPLCGTPCCCEDIRSGSDCFGATLAMAISVLRFRPRSSGNACNDALS